MSQRVFRFAVGQWDQSQSTVWRIWATPAGDVYISPRSVGGIVKGSLHKDGNYSFGLTREHVRKGSPFLGADQDRMSLRWRRPSPMSPGITHVFAIVVPSSELRPALAPSNDPKVQWLLAAEIDEAVEVHVFLVSTNGPAGDTLMSDGGRPTTVLWESKFRTGELLVVAATVADFKGRAREQLEKTKAAMQKTLDGQKHEPGAIDPRGHLFVTGAEGFPYLVDVALPLLGD